LDGLHSRELWKSDGSESGTQLVKNINPSGVGTSEGFYPGEYLSLNELIFSADDGAFGDELWKTDGTDMGTGMLQDIASGSNPSDPKGMTLVDGKIFFFANDNEHDYELWVLPLISMSEVTLSGETEGEIGVEYSFGANVNPGDALTPLTYTWTATGQNEVKHDGSLNDIVSFTWDSPGPKTISITVSGIVNSVTDVMTIDISGPQVPLGSLTLTGDNEGDVGIAYSFTASVSPSEATTPITYEWQATGHTPQVNLGGLSDTVEFNWSSPGVKTITVTANNGVNELSKQVEIEISEQLSEIFIPIVVRK
jgi:ELWxxDGT repeat protein